MTPIGASFRNFRDRTRAAISLKAQNVLFFIALALVILLAIMIRMTPVLRGPTLIKAFDPWIQYYTAQYLSEHTLFEYYHWHDTKSWYPGGVDRAKLRPGLPFTVVIIHKIMNFVGIPVTIYQVCFYFPAFMGGATVYAMYLLGKEVMDRRAGLFAAFFLAFNTGHMQRTMAGFFDNETIGVFATLMTFVFFLKAIKTGKFSHSVIGGVFLGYLALSWGGYNFAFLLLPIICGVLVLTKKYNENVLIAYAGTQGVGAFIFSFMVQFDHEDSILSDISIGGTFWFSIILIVFHIIYTKRNDFPRFYEGLLSSISWILIPGALIFAIIIWAKPDLLPVNFGGRLTSILSPLLRDQMHIVASVAEHMPSAWGIFYYNTLIPLLLLPLGIFFCFKRLEADDVFMITFLLTLFYFTGSMIRIILLFAPAAALMGAYGLVNILKVFGSFVGEEKSGVSRKRKRQVSGKNIGNSEAFAVYFIIGFLCITQIIHATDISINQLSYSQIVAGGQFHDWEESLTWMKNNLEGTDVVVSWWDYGYWLTPIGNVTTVNDNGTNSDKRIGLTGMALMQTNEIYSAKILRELEADYVLVYFGHLINGLGGDEGKWPWMLRICNDHYNYYKDQGYEEDNWKENSVFDEDEYINSTSGAYRDNWFDSQLVKLMFYDEPTNPSSVNPNTDYLKWYYASQVSGNPSQGVTARKDDEGNDWSTHIPTDGQYDFKVFKKAYFSQNGMVKLFKVDYTALDSSFEISEGELYDNGYGSFKISNTGTKELTIKSVKINNIAYNFSVGIQENEAQLEEGTDDIIWVDTAKSLTYFNKDDVVNITVSAEAEALDDDTYVFNNYTNNFFVTQAPEGEIRINRDNSKVIRKDGAQVVHLEVENTGDSIVRLEDFYIGENTKTYNSTNIHFLSDYSRILEPGEITKLTLENPPGGRLLYSPDGIYSDLVGVSGVNNIYDETVFSINFEGYKLSILDEDRIQSPELAIVDNRTYRNHIPIDFNNMYAYSFENGEEQIKINVKNTGDTVIGLDSVYIAPRNEVEYGTGWYYIETPYSVNFDTVDHNLILNPGQENYIIIESSELDFTVNDELVVTITAIGYEGDAKASDVGVIHAVSDKQNIQVIESIYDIDDDFVTSYVLANETARLMIKNTGNDTITLDKIYLNSTHEFNFTNDEYLDVIIGSKTLNTQEIAVVSLNLSNTGMEINKSTEVHVNVTTTLGNVEDDATFNALVNAPNAFYYSVDIDPATAAVGGDLDFDINNLGTTNVTVHSIYINDTYVPLVNFTLNAGETFEIGKQGGIIHLEITLLKINEFISPDFTAGDKLKILIRTKEGPEDERIITVS